MKSIKLLCFSALFMASFVSLAQNEAGFDSINGVHRGYVDLPSKVSLLQYCPEVKNQGPYGTSTVWASVYAARTIAEAVKLGWTEKGKITKEAFSPLFVYAQIKKDDDVYCERGTHIHEALESMAEIGTVKFKDFDHLCASNSDVDKTMLESAKRNRPDSYSCLFAFDEKNADKKIWAVKKSLSENHPVVIAMWLDKPSFNKTKALLDLSTVDEKFPIRSMSQGEGYHAMCVVGYDDNMYGGAFQIMNSWGTGWGDNGFFWAKYDDFARTVDQAYDLCVKPVEKRIALVIGNSYGTNPHFPALRTPENDAKDMTRKLDSLGFDVRQYLNLGLRKMEKVVDSFCSDAKQYDVALLFFTGNGMRQDHQDYMAANDCEKGNYGELTKGLSVDDVMERMERSGCPLRIGMFDICRLEVDTKVLHRGPVLTRSHKKEQGEIRIFSSKQDGYAYDGDGNHSPFYEAVAFVLNTCPEVSLDVFERRIAEYVFAKTNGAQIVSSEKTMIGDFYFTIEKLPEEL